MVFRLLGDFTYSLSWFDIRTSKDLDGLQAKAKISGGSTSVEMMEIFCH